MNNEVKWTMIANCTIWIATAMAVLGATYITKSASCLWGLFIPVFTGGFSYKENNRNN